MLELLCTWHYSIIMSIAVVRTVRRVTVAIAFCLLVSLGCVAGDSCVLLLNTVDMPCRISNACDNDSLIEMTNNMTKQCTSPCIHFIDREEGSGSSGNPSDCNCTLTVISFNENSTSCNCTNLTPICISINESMNDSTTSPQVTTMAATSLPVTTMTTTTASPGATTSRYTSTAMADHELTTVTSDFAATVTSEPYSKPATPVLVEQLALWLWVALGVLLLLIVCVVALILFIAVACCCRHHKRKEPPTTMDIVSKWEDVPDESSDIKLVSIKSIGDDEGKDGEKENNGDVAKSEETKKDESGKGKEEKKDGDITLGTFGFPEVVVEPTALKAENTGYNETEKKEGDGNEGNTADKKEQKAEESSDKSPGKSVDESTNSSSGAVICSTSADEQNATTETAIPQDKQNTTESTSPEEVATIESTKVPLQEGTKPVLVPVNIPTFGNQQKEEQALVSGSGLNTSTDKTDQPASPTKQQALSTEVSNASKEMTINTKVSTDTGTAATSEPQAQTTDVQPLLSDKPSDATGGLLSFEDIEKALGLVKGVGQDDSTQM